MTTVVGFAFYFRVVAAIFAAPDEEQPTLEASMSARFAAITATAITVVFGIVPWILIDVVRDALPL